MNTKPRFIPLLSDTVTKFLIKDGSKEESQLEYELQVQKYNLVLKEVKKKLEIYPLNCKRIVHNKTNKYDTYISILTAGESINKVMDYADLKKKNKYLYILIYFMLVLS